MDAVPIEILLQCLQYLDVKSILQFSVVSKDMYALAQDKHLWIEACRRNYLARAFIEAANLWPDLQSGKLNARSFLISFLSQDLNKLKFEVENKEIALYFPLYEHPNCYQLRFFQSPYSKRKLFLTKEIAKELILNRESVKDFIQTSVPFEIIDLNSLAKMGMTYCVPKDYKSAPDRSLCKLQNM